VTIATERTKHRAADVHRGFIGAPNNNDLNVAVRAFLAVYRPAAPGSAGAGPGGR
jgi:hypothetical protein